MSLYSTVPNSTIFFKQLDQDEERRNRGQIHIALTPPNTPTHGVIINEWPTSPFNESGQEEELLNQPKAYILMNNECLSSQSTPSDLRSICSSPDWMNGTDPLHLPQLSTGGPQWNDLNTKGKVVHLARILLKITALVLLLYFFICSLDLLSISFRLLGARVIGNFFTDNALIQNPVVGLMIGVLVTVLVQSSSTSTSIAVTMVASRIIHVRQAIPIMMGANIGTSVTSTIVSLMQSADRKEFSRAFAAATVHDMFNWLTVIILLPLEITTRYLEQLTTLLMNFSKVGQEEQDKSVNKQFLNHLTKPFTKKIIQIDTKLIETLAYGNISSEEEASIHLLLRCCFNGNKRPTCHKDCSLFGWLGFADTPTGLLLLVLSILVLCLCLMMLVKVLNSMLTGQIAKLIKKTMNRSYTFPYSILADYLSILAGCILTILVQSSSIFTSALTPLAGIGVISLERIYPLTLGANIGTTTTGILAALAADSNRLYETMQIALCHLFFNITGILLFYPIPWMRIPIPMARILGNVTANYRWFSIFYLLVMFFFLPLIVFSLSTLGPVAMFLVGVPCLILSIFVIVVNAIQRYHSNWLPNWLTNWQFLPIWMRSLDPMDRFITKLGKELGCKNCCATSGQFQHVTFERGNDRMKLIRHTDAHHSRVNILGAMYKSNSENHFDENIIIQPRHHDMNNVNETIKKVIFKLSKTANNPNQHNYRFGFNTPSLSNKNWSLFNSHTIHNCFQMDQPYPSSPFARDSSQLECIKNSKAQMEKSTSDESGQEHISLENV